MQLYPPRVPHLPQPPAWKPSQRGPPLHLSAPSPLGETQGLGDLNEKSLEGHRTTWLQSCEHNDGSVTLLTSGSAVYSRMPGTGASAIPGHMIPVGDDGMARF